MTHLNGILAECVNAAMNSLKIGTLATLPYDPGVLPTLPAPVSGDRIVFRVNGLPPYKEISQSIRNVTHPRYESFVRLRAAAIAAMNGRAWYFGPINLDLTIYAPALHAGRSLADYMGGVMDTLGGSSGVTFTYLPVVYQDDCQVFGGRNCFQEVSEEYYEIDIQFMRSGEPDS